MIIEEKTKSKAGADEKTPSRSQYFSWINNTNEGSTEKQTLINLEYFGWLKKTYGMQLDIYAWDAGNLDGSSGTYQKLDSPKIKKQYPNGYGPIAKAAEKIGTRLGVWCGPDGFGENDKEAEQRHNLIVSLCKDYHFALFKLDGVCGGLRPEKQENFVKMIKECRKYSPDLIILNHRLNLGIGNPYTTTFLWNGQETYTDVLIGNNCTAPHNRAYLFHRGNVPGLKRLSEDHGVCISSCIDYFEDELIYQAFGRCLILSPEIYGNPWLMRDDEQARLARIYNLHRRYRDILVNGITLPEKYGPSAVSRGNEKIRFITTGNPTWKNKKVSIKINKEIGIGNFNKFAVSTHHPYEKFIGTFNFGDIAEIEIPAFRACLIEISEINSASPMLTGCEYQVIHETEKGNIDKIKILSIFDEIKITGNIPNLSIPEVLVSAEKFDNTIREPKFLSSAKTCSIPENAEQLFETARFVMNMDSLEARSLKRSGETAIPEVKAARDAFFNQKTYLLRGCESRFAFDGKEDTFFDGVSKTFFGGFRLNGGCLRVDFGDIYDADYIMIEYFDIDNDSDNEIKKQTIPPKGDISKNLLIWKDVFVKLNKTIRQETVEAVVGGVHNIVEKKGKRKQTFYYVGDKLRYFRLPNPFDRIYKIAVIKDGKETDIKNPHINNLLPSYKDNPPVCSAQKATITITPEDFKPGCYIAVGLNGEHGKESAYAVAEIDGKLSGFPERAPSYLSNSWETFALTAMNTDKMYTYYLPVTEYMIGKKITIYIIFCDKEKTNVNTEIYLCDANNKKDGIETDIFL